MPVTGINKNSPILKGLSVLGFLFLLGALGGLNFAPLSVKLFAVMVITIIPLLIFIVLLVAGYMAVAVIINYYFKQIRYGERVVLTILGLIALFTGFYITNCYV